MEYSKKLARHLQTIRGSNANDNFTERTLRNHDNFGQSLVNLNQKWGMSQDYFSHFLETYKQIALTFRDTCVNEINYQHQNGVIPKDAAMVCLGVSLAQNLYYLMEVMPKEEYEFVCEYLLDHIEPIVKQRDQANNQPPIKE